MKVYGWILYGLIMVLWRFIWWFSYGSLWSYEDLYYSPPARWGLLDFIRAVVLLLLLVLVLLLRLRLLLQFLQCALLDLNLGPSQLSVHRWTSTWDLPSSVCTAGPQPGTFPAQCAPLDLNLGPSQLSVHRWTSTWDLPSSVCTAGPQRPDRMPEDMPEGMQDRMPDKMSDRMPDARMFAR